MARDAGSASGAIVADTGSPSRDNMKVEQPGRQLFIATRKARKQRARPREGPPPRGGLPNAMAARKRKDRRL